MILLSNLRVRSAGLVNSLLRRFGVELKECAKQPHHNLLGLRNISFSTVIDVGANEGQFVAEFREFFPEAIFYSFEPLPSCFSVLTKQSGGDRRWQCFNTALGCANKRAEFYFHQNHPSSSSFLPDTIRGQSLYPETQEQSIVTVDCVTLDSWADSHPNVLKPPVLLKMDVQGYESQVLHGAKQTLNAVDAVITEVIVESLYKGQSTFDEQVRLLARAGLVFCGVLRHAFDLDQNPISLDCVFRRHPGRKKF
jgi:FkbM family methyltransferase